MPTKLEKLIEHNTFIETMMELLKTDLKILRRDMIKQKKKTYTTENASLRKEIELATKQLITLEISNGKTQVAVPGTETNSSLPSATVMLQPSQCQNEGSLAEPLEKPKKEKKIKKAKPTVDEKCSDAGAAEPPLDVGRLDFRIGKIIDVSKHPDADSLYVEKIDCGEENPRTVVSGLVKFVPIEKMQNRMVVVMCNLKPAKMRGITSEAMVMCASTAEKVEVLLPPATAVPGDLVHCEGYERKPDPQLNPKKKIFETCAPDLMTNNELVACFKKSALHVPGKGNIMAESLKNVNVK